MGKAVGLPPARQPLSAEALEFAPGLLAIQQSPPARLPRTMFYVVGTLFAVLVIGVCVGKLDIIASADGRLVPQSYMKVVQPPDAGIVKEILVREGQLVAKGQVLLRMDPHDSDADLTTLTTQVALKSLQLRRVDAELAGQPLLRQGDDPSDLFDHVQKQYRDRRQTYLDSLAQANGALQKAKHDYDAGIEVLNKLQQVTPILKSQADAYADMGQGGFAPQTTISDKQRAYLESQQDLRAQIANVQSLSSAISEASLQAAVVAAKYRSDLQNERIEAETEYRKLTQELSKQGHKSSLLELRAPEAGIVKDLSTHTLGAVVTAGTVLLSLIPQDEPMVAEVMVRNEDVGFVNPGQQVKVKLAAYPFQRYGLIDGEVLQLWPDASEEDNSSKGSSKDERAGVSGDRQLSSYKALIKLQHQTLSFDGNTLKLVPGMQVSAEINQGKRTVLEYLLSPVRKTLQESARER